MLSVTVHPAPEPRQLPSLGGRGLTRAKLVRAGKQRMSQARTKLPGVLSGGNAEDMLGGGENVVCEYGGD
eukprot:SAG31_NODE_3707_length_3970_cov_8.036941_6_plen_70_part_00